jgi:outer membrane protein TolC
MVRATRTFARSTALQVEAAKVALSGSVAQAYVNLARAEAQERIAREFLANREASLKLTQNRGAAALATEIDIAAAQTLLAQARQALVRAEGQRALMVHALAALAGRGADYYGDRPATLRPKPPCPCREALPPICWPAAPICWPRNCRWKWPWRRKIQRAAFYPDVNLQAGLQALGIGSLFTGGAAMAGVGPALHLPIFQGGALKARYRASVAGAMWRSRNITRR